eukprot:1157821-Pelagomonas_calceolata.AAC.2
MPTSSHLIGASSPKVLSLSQAALIGRYTQPCSPFLSQNILSQQQQCHRCAPHRCLPPEADSGRMVQIQAIAAQTLGGCCWRPAAAVPAAAGRLQPLPLLVCCWRWWAGGRREHEGLLAVRQIGGWVRLHRLRWHWAQKGGLGSKRGP